MENPTQDQLQHFVLINQNSPMALGQNKPSRGWHVRWSVLLIQKYPTLENLELIKRTLVGGYTSQKYGWLRVLKSILKASPLTEAHIDLALMCGEESIQERAIRVRTRLYEI